MSKDFQRKDNHCTDRIDDSWRKPRGSQNKQRLGKRGQPKAVDTGYRTEKDERHKWNGKAVVTVTSKDELDSLEAQSQAARIPSMGRRKKTPLVQHAVDNDVDIVNLDEEAYLDKTEAFLHARKQKQERRAAEEAEEASDADDDAADDEETAEKDDESRDEPSDKDDESDDDTEPSDDDDGDQSTDRSDDDAVSAENAPTSDNTVKEIKTWLDDNDIDYTSSMLKADLLDQVNEHTEDEP